MWRRRARARWIVVVAAAMVAVLTSSAVADAGHGGGDHSVAELIGEVARVQQRIADLGAEIQSQQEGVNKALLDVGDAQETLRSTRADADVAQRAVENADRAISSAQRRFDQFAVSMYMNGASDSLLTAASPDEVLAVAAATEMVAISHQQVIAALTRAHTEQVNAESTARAATALAEEAAATVQLRFDDAVSALESARTTFGDQQRELDLLATQLDGARARLRAAQHVAAPTAGPAVPDSGPTMDSWTSDDGPTEGEEGLWDTTLPAVPSANVTGDPLVIINTVLQISATSAQITSNLGRQFLTRVGILEAPTAATDTGITNGRIPRVYGRQAIEYVIKRAMSQIGVPYSWGGGNANGPSRGIDQGANTVGFDCSGLMLYAFAGVGIQLDHYSGSQYNAGRQIPSSQMQRGDLIFYGPNASQHEAMYLGNGMMLEAPFTGSQVRVAPVRTGGMTPYVTRLIEW